MKPTLILVDDSKETRKRLHAILQEQFEIIDEVESGDLAIVAANRHRPQLMLMDVVMPIKSGIEATRAILAEVEPPPKVVMLSGIRDETLVLQALQAGAIDYLFKPVDPGKLLRVLWEVIR